MSSKIRSKNAPCNKMSEMKIALFLYILFTKHLLVTRFLHLVVTHYPCCTSFFLLFFLFVSLHIIMLSHCID
uniref:Uncharacterized protein n=1 Tax=Anguilla anguilla TaxID=7936 RepID=A0A0E9XFI6_ANGAN